MKHSLALFMAPVALGAHSVTVKETEDFDVHSAVLVEAFDPDRLFQDQFRFEPILTIRYLGDDWELPVYAIALFEGCHVDDPKDDQSCRDRLEARMIRAPYDGEPERPRWRGSQLLGELGSRAIGSHQELLAALDDGIVEWLETDLAECPTGMEYARDIEGIPWFNEPLIRESKGTIVLKIHYDTIEVRFRPNYFTDMRYFGHVEDGLPSGWADGFAKSLENCWKPSSAPTPWRREPLENEGDE